MDKDSIGYTDPNQDKFLQHDRNDTRKPSITLYHLNKLKKMRAAKELENLMKQDLWGLMYGKKTDDQGGLGI